MSPRLAPRYYSISSSPKANPGVVTATVAVVRGETPTGRTHEGVASTFLAAALSGARVPVFVRTSSFKLPEDPAVRLTGINSISGDGVMCLNSRNEGFGERVS